MLSALDLSGSSPGLASDPTATTTLGTTPYQANLPVRRRQRWQPCCHDPETAPVVDAVDRIGADRRPRPIRYRPPTTSRPLPPVGHSVASGRLPNSCGQRCSASTAGRSIESATTRPRQGSALEVKGRSSCGRGGRWPGGAGRPRDAAVVPETVTEEVQAPMAIPIESRRIGTARVATRRACIGPGP